MSAEAPSSEGKAVEGVSSQAATALNTDSITVVDPFASQRSDNAIAQSSGVKASTTTASPAGRRSISEDSPEWDAAKTPPSKFQQRKGSLRATPCSRDSHVDRNKERDQKFHDTVDTMKSGFLGGHRRKSSSKSEDAEKKDGQGEK